MPTPTPESYQKASSKPYEERPVVGKFRVVQGSHSEGGQIYRAGEVVESRSDLLKLNAPNAVKFARVEEGDSGANVLRSQYQPENPDTLPPSDKENFDQGKGVPAQTGEGDPSALGASTADKGMVLAYDDELDDMTVEDLRELAGEEEIDLGPARRKDDILRTIRSARAARTDESEE